MHHCHMFIFRLYLNMSAPSSFFLLRPLMASKFSPPFHLCQALKMYVTHPPFLDIWYIDVQGAQCSSPRTHSCTPACMQAHVHPLAHIGLLTYIPVVLPLSGTFSLLTFLFFVWLNSSCLHARSHSCTPACTNTHTHSLAQVRAHARTHTCSLRHACTPVCFTVAPTPTPLGWATRVGHGYGCRCRCRSHLSHLRARVWWVDAGFFLAIKSHTAAAATFTLDSPKLPLRPPASCLSKVILIPIQAFLIPFKNPQVPELQVAISTSGPHGLR